MEPVLSKNALDPTPKHECHVSKNASRITSLLAYRAYELTQVCTWIQFSVKDLLLYLCVCLSSSVCKQVLALVGV